MKASTLEFRFRYAIHFALYLLGFLAPWDYALHLDSIRTWQFLAAWPARSGWVSFSSATILVLVFGILCALASALLRTWASAYIGASIVQDPAMHGGRVVAAGPYRFLRNPLYLGTFLNALALCLLMPPSGAIFTVVAVGIFELRLILSEEYFLAGSLGELYLSYCARVPRLFPSLRPRLAVSPLKARWPSAFLGEIYPWGTFLSFLLLGWHYNAMLITQGVLVSIGLSFVARAFLRKD